MTVWAATGNGLVPPLDGEGGSPLSGEPGGVNIPYA